MTLGQIWYIATILTQINICAINLFAKVMLLGGDHLILRGGGGGAGKFGRDTDYLIIYDMSSAGKFIFRYFQG